MDSCVPSLLPHTSQLSGLGECTRCSRCPAGSIGNRMSLQCRRHGRLEFHPWVRKIPWKRAWQPTPVFSPGESLGQRSLAGYSPWGHRVGTNWSDWARTHTSGLIYPRKDDPGGETCRGPACKLWHLGRECWATRCLEKDLAAWASSLAQGRRTQLEEDQSGVSTSQSPGHGPCSLGLRAAWKLSYFKSQWPFQYCPVGRNSVS